MIWALALLLSFIAVAALAWWQLVRSIRSRRVEIKGWVFEKAEQPFHYWSNLTAFLLAALLTSSVALLMVIGFLASA